MSGGVSSGPALVQDGIGQLITSTGNALDVNLKSATGGVIIPVSGTVTANQGTSPWVTSTQTAATGTQSSIASSASDVTILAANANRRGATIYNDSTQILYLLLASAVSSSTNYTVQVPPQNYNGYYEVPFNYTGIIKGIWASANGNARVTEFTA